MIVCGNNYYRPYMIPYAGGPWRKTSAAEWLACPIVRKNSLLKGNMLDLDWKLLPLVLLCCALPFGGSVPIVEADI